MNSVSNSDSKQCTESKLGWVHRMHTLNPNCAPTARALRPGRARTTPCRGVQCAMSQAQHRLCRKPPRSYHGCVAARTRALLCLVSRPCCCRIAGRVATHLNSQAFACHDKTDCIVTRSLTRLPSCHETKTVS